MSGNSGTENGQVDSVASAWRRGDYATELTALREVLDTAPVAGRPREEAELADLERLVRKYPAQAYDLTHGTSTE